MRIASLVVLCGLTFFGTLCTDATAADKAPDFTLKNLKGKNVRLSEVCKEGPVLLSFWSTWCKNCPAEMKHYQRFAEKYAKQGLTVLSISIDNSKTVSKVRPWIQGRRFTFPVLLDTNNKVKRLFHVGPVPHTFVLDRQGHIAYSHVGYRAGDEVATEKEILKVLQQKPVDTSDSTGGSA
jgi:peroxiredoxin